MGPSDFRLEVDRKGEQLDPGRVVFVTKTQTCAAKCPGVACCFCLGPSQLRRSRFLFGSDQVKKLAKIYQSPV